MAPVATPRGRIFQHDRESGGQAALAEVGVELCALLKMRDLEGAHS
jgi:orotate phosphoribosyltransferase